MGKKTLEPITESMYYTIRLTAVLRREAYVPQYWRIYI